MGVTNNARIEFLEDTFGNSKGDIVRVVEETEKEVLYYDSDRRWSFLYKTEEGTVYHYIPRGQRKERVRCHAKS